MQTRLASFIDRTPLGQEAAEILARCVHCGFCNATCPTYQLLGDELDGPRGRIYLIKQVLEGEKPTGTTRIHLDRCLTCRNCETTCPSGVQYGRLFDIGRKFVEARVGRPIVPSIVRAFLRVGLTSAAFAPALKLAQKLKPWLPRALGKKIPAQQYAGTWPKRHHARKMLLLAGCVQPALLPNINAATARVLDVLGIELLVPRGAGCCGAIRYHLNDHAGGLAQARRNIDAWWPHIEAGCEALVMNASGCGLQVKEYGYLLRDDPNYAQKAQRIAAVTRDVAELLSEFTDELRAALRCSALLTTVNVRGNAVQTGRATRVVFHPPCTLQHGQRIWGTVESLLTSLGAEILPFEESHLCCGAAGTYFLLQPKLAVQLRDRKLARLNQPSPEAVLSANIGCITHLQGGTHIPIMHWIEWLDARLGC